MGLLDGLKNLFGGKKKKDKAKKPGKPAAAAPAAPKKVKKKKVPKTDLEKRFEIRRQSGQGSMSKVFLAYDRQLGRQVCLKILDKLKTERFEQRFKALGLDRPTEGEICLQLAHQNMVKTYDHGVSTKGEPFLVMEWIEGLGLNYLIETKSKQLAGGRVAYLIQLCEAIQFLHDQRFLHRDLCPRNVMVDGDGTVKLIDFGLTIPYTPQFCQPGNRTGTADYLAPEIIKRQRTDHRVDLFALGVTAYEVFSGELPWERSASSEETLRRHLNSPPRDLKDVMPDADDRLSRVIMKAIARDPGDRYASARAFAEALDRLERDDD